MAAVADTLFIVGVLAAAGHDLWRRRIPNWLTVPLFLVGLALRLTLNGGSSALYGLAGGVVGLGLFIVQFRARWIGAGDVKLAIAMGAWLGPLGILWAALAGMVGNGLIALGITLAGGQRLRGEVGQNLANAVLTMRSPDAPQREARYRVPVGVPLALAGIGVLFLIPVSGGLHA